MNEANNKVVEGVCNSSEEGTRLRERAQRREWRRLCVNKWIWMWGQGGGGSGPTTDTHNPRIRKSYGRRRRREGWDGADNAEIVGDEWRVPSQRGSGGRREETLPPSLSPYDYADRLCVEEEGQMQKLRRRKRRHRQNSPLSIYPSWIERERGKEEENWRLE